MFRDIGILGTGLWNGPIVNNDFFQIEDVVHKDLFKGIRDEDGIVRIAGLELTPSRYARTIAAVERSFYDPYRGTCRRRFFPRDGKPSDMETEAARRAIEDAGLRPDDIDAVLVQSFISDQLQPKNAPLVARNLGIHKALALEVDSMCNSPMTQAAMGAALISSGQARHVLCVQSVLYSWVSDLGSSGAIQEGDMASAFVLGRCRGSYMTFSSHIEGQLHGAISLNWTKPARTPPRRYWEPSQERMLIIFDKQLQAKLMGNMAEYAPSLCQRALQQADMRLGDIDTFICHQPISWSKAFLEDTLGLPDGITIDIFDEYANIGSSSITASIHEARQRGLWNSGKKVLIFAPGAGYMYVAAALGI